MTEIMVENLVEDWIPECSFDDVIKNVLEQKISQIPERTNIINCKTLTGWFSVNFESWKERMGALESWDRAENNKEQSLTLRILYKEL